MFNFSVSFRPCLVNVARAGSHRTHIRCCGNTQNMTMEKSIKIHRRLKFAVTNYLLLQSKCYQIPLYGDAHKQVYIKSKYLRLYGHFQRRSHNKPHHIAPKKNKSKKLLFFNVLRESDNLMNDN